MTRGILITFIILMQFAELIICLGGMDTIDATVSGMDLFIMIPSIIHSMHRHIGGMTHIGMEVTIHQLFNTEKMITLDCEIKMVEEEVQSPQEIGVEILIYKLPPKGQD